MIKGKIFLCKPNLSCCSRNMISSNGISLPHGSFSTDAAMNVSRIPPPAGAMSFSGMISYLVVGGVFRRLSPTKAALNSQLGYQMPSGHPINFKDPWESNLALLIKYICVLRTYNSAQLRPRQLQFSF